MPEQTLKAKLVADVAQFQRDMKDAAATTRETAASRKGLQSAGAAVGAGTDSASSAMAGLGANATDVEAMRQLVGKTILHLSADSLNGECYGYYSDMRADGITVRFYNIAPLYELGEGRMRRLN